MVIIVLFLGSCIYKLISVKGEIRISKNFDNCYLYTVYIQRLCRMIKYQVVKTTHGNLNHSIFFTNMMYSNSQNKKSNWETNTRNKQREFLNLMWSCLGKFFSLCTYCKDRTNYWLPWLTEGQWVICWFATLASSGVFMRSHQYASRKSSKIILEPSWERAESTILGEL